MKTLHHLCAAALVLSGAPLAAQTTPPTAGAPNAAAPTATATPAAALTDAEQATLKRCQAMQPGQAAQSSKCSKVMSKAGLGDPAKTRGPAVDPNR